MEGPARFVLAQRGRAMQSGGMQSEWQNAIYRAEAHSPFLTLSLGRNPAIAELLASGAGQEALAAARAAGDGCEDVGSALRRERQALALVLGIGDLAGAFPLGVVMRELSALADRALDRAIAEAIRRRVPDAPPRGFVALALGKQGAGELNYSSDIDPILLYDPRTLPRRERDDPGEAAQRYARAIMELLAHQTGEGLVFRVDLRLRPAAEVSPLAIPVAGALSHYESSALAWERAAFIRARAAGGDVAMGEEFLAAIRPFVWRRSLDFTAIEEIRRLTKRIRDAYRGPPAPSPGFDLKRGRGGIREIEFFAQTHQLIYGGRMPQLRVRGTRAALDALAGAGIIATEDAQVLGRAYDRLRVIEHRLQMVDDRQTHALPEDEGALDNVARLDGLDGGTVLVAELAELCGAVAERYDSLLDRGEGPARAPAAGPSRFAERAEHWRNSIRALRGAEARAAFGAILPDLLEALEAAPDPERAAIRWETLLARLPTAVNLFRLFERRPGLLQLVLRILTLAPPLADELARRPDRLDALIDSSAFDLPGGVEELAARMQTFTHAGTHGGTHGGDYESRLDRIRQVVGDERFALGVQLIEGRQDPLAVAEGLARVAEAALASAAGAAEDAFAAQHGRIAGAELGVLGLGRLGGGALTHASDLDLIYVFSGEIGAESDGRRPLTASLYFNRLAQRVSAALSVPTAEGALYEVDTRLRPQGNQGMLAVGLDSFARYQQEDAWTWEHMALCRARAIHGSPQLRAALERAIAGVLDRERNPDRLRADILAMRAEMAAHKQPAGPLDIKLLRGGLVDCEFAVHYLQLRERTAFDPALDRAIPLLTARGLLPAGFAAHHALLARLLVSVRLLAPGGHEPPEAARAVLAEACGMADYPALLQAADEARQEVAQSWAELFGQQLEI